MRNILPLFFLIFSLVIPGAALAACETRDTRSIDVVIGQLDAGSYLREGFRISPDGTLSRALWNDGNNLLGRSQLVDLGVEAYQSALADISRTQPRHAMVPNDGTIPSPPTFTVEIAYLEPGGKTRFVFRIAATPALSGLIEAWRGAAPVSAPPSGNYIWSILAPNNPGRADLALSADGCGGDIEKNLAEALGGSHIVTRTDSAFRGFVETNPGRSRFIADLPDGHAYFGILSGR
ncbi:MAG: hypothetical protein RID15_11765 [Marinovum algicola]|uniref:Uncharacterized protein n=1 Tax=Marinovum algicola TaxID=42444 RepID=A0A975W6L5_9RHOB|nr:hypothetical protein [Marinovum algicola]SEI58102.1 hypothetical protein SAMN04487940_101286 [Marinovum algicola]SLN27764.1 hypothetical protein MAA5396_01171 [Marinovum algicola]